MPNWCENVIQIQGVAAERAAFATRVATGDSPLSFARHVPEPETYPPLESYPDSHPMVMLQRMMGTGGRDEWYLWRSVNWGTKWDVAGEDVQVIDPGPTDDAATLEYRFLTAWNPPLAWLKAASEQHPDLIFTLAALEQAVDFAMITRLRAGVALEEISRDPQDMKGELQAMGLEVWEIEDDEPEIAGP